MRLIQHLLVLLYFAVVTLTSHAAAAGSASVRAILIIASKEKGAPDPKLAAYEPVLRSNLPFQSFHYVGEGSAAVAAGGTATLSLPNGNHVELERDKAGGPAKVHFGNAVIAVSPGGRPVVLVGGQSGNKGDVFGIIVMAN